MKSKMLLVLSCLRASSTNIRVFTYLAVSFSTDLTCTYFLAVLMRIFINHVNLHNISFRGVPKPGRMAFDEHASLYQYRMGTTSHLPSSRL